MKWGALAIAFAAACSSPEPSGPQPVTTGTHHHYVTRDLTIPVSPELQRELGLNIDHDPSGKPDNQLGNVFVALTGNSDADLQGVIDDAIAGGSLVMLHSVRADALASDTSVSWQVHRGAEVTRAPAFDGSDVFAIEAAERTADPVLGRTRDGGFDPLGSGRVTIELAVSAGQPKIALDLIAAQVEAEIDAQGCRGRIGGAVTQKDLDEELLPAVVGMMNAAIARDPGCPSACAAGTSAALIIEVFDTNEDGAITLPELRDNALMQTLLAPDLDLLDEAGAVEPDGLEESVSLGVGFECVAASFTVEGETP